MKNFERQIKLIGLDNFEKLRKSNILVVGIGGVGGYACEMLARTGIGKMTIIDFDKVDNTNINRQIIALQSSVGKFKVDVMKDRLLDINPNLEVVAKKIKLDKTNIDNVLENQYDYIIDAIDILNDKIDLIRTAKKLKLNIVSAMGAGNRFGIPQYVVCDIYKTQNDGLAKKLRKQLRENNIESLDVVCSVEKSVSISNGVGSIAYQPSVCGITLASFVINQLIKGE